MQEGELIGKTVAISSVRHTNFPVFQTSPRVPSQTRALYKHTRVSNILKEKETSYFFQVVLTRLALRVTYRYYSV